jgi:acetolactate synthase-1/2/3 large subunit
VDNAIRKGGFVLAERKTTTAADFLLEYLSQIKVDKIFGVPGGAIEPLFDAVARFDRDVFSSRPVAKGLKPWSKIDLITTRHEVGAAFMADGYARETGHLAVCCATTGPGTTNLLTGVASAYMDNIPMLVLTPQTSISTFGRNDLQDSSDDSISTVAMFAHCTRYNSMVTHVDQLKHKLVKAVKTAFTYPYGPVHLSIPREIWDQEMSEAISANLTSFKPRGNEGYDSDSYKILCRLATNDNRLLFLLGPDCLPYAESIVECAELLNADIVTTPAAKGCIQANHPLYRGVLGYAGHPQAEDVLWDERVDHIVTIGTNLNSFETAGLCDSMAVIEKMIYINHVVSDGLVAEAAHLQLYGSLKKIFNDFACFLTKHQALVARLDGSPLQRRCNLVQHVGVPQVGCKDGITISTSVNQSMKSTLVKPQYLMSKLPGMLPSSARFYVDAGNSWAWATHYLHPHSVSNYKIAMGFGSMGWGIGAAVGAACAQDEAPVVCITGDGSYLMSGQEITVAVQQQLSVVFVVLNDSAFGMVKHGQRIGGAEQIGFELPGVNFAMMAQAVGARGVTIPNAQALDELDLGALLEIDGPVLLDIHIDAEEVPPMAARLKDLGRG